MLSMSTGGPLVTILNSPWLWFGGFAACIALVWYSHGRIGFWITDARKAIANVFMPFAVIASELRRMNDLKTLELASRLNPKTGDPDPIIPITENPGRNDTEVLWGVEENPKGLAAMRASLVAQWEREAGDDEE